MRKTVMLVVIFIFVFMLSTAYTAVWMGWKGKTGGDSSWCQRMFAPDNLIVIKGTIKDIEQGCKVWAPVRGESYGVHVIVSTGKKEVPVHLGPAWYVERQSIKFKKGDVLEVKGSEIECEGENILVAIQVEKAGDVLTLRDETGCPAWASAKQQ